MRNEELTAGMARIHMMVVDLVPLLVALGPGESSISMASDIENKGGGR